MSTLDTTSSFLSYGESYPSGGQTQAASSGALAITEQDEEQLVRKAWDDVVNSKLIEWGRNPGQLEDEELIPPSRAALARAADLVFWLRNSGSAAPMRVVPDGDAGIVFERWDSDSSAAFEISGRGSVEFVSTHHGRVESRITCFGSK